MTMAPNGETLLHYELSGAGSPVLFLLPQSTGPGGRRHVHDAIKGQHSLMTYDQRGTGRSSPSTVQMSMAAQAEDALAILDHAGIEAAHLFCHSTGCGIGLSLAANHGDRVKSIALTNPWTHGDAHLSTMQRLRIAAARARDSKSYAQFNSALLFPPEYRREHADAFAAQCAAAAAQDADNIERRLEAILAFDARPLLARISAPALVVSAADDQLMPPWFAKEIAVSMSRAQLHTLDGGGHMLPETRPEELSQLTLAHLAHTDTVTS